MRPPKDCAEDPTQRAGGVICRTSYRDRPRCVACNIIPLSTGAICPHSWLILGNETAYQRALLSLSWLTAARSGEVRGMRWDEIDLRSCVWTLPAGRMKAGKEHRVPLTARAIGGAGGARTDSCAGVPRTL